MYQGRLIRCEAPDALKRNIQEACYEVRASDARRAREILERIPGVMSVEPAGAGLHLFLVPSQTSPDRLQEEVMAGGIAAVAFKPIVPSLEDAFIALIRKAEN